METFARFLDFVAALIRDLIADAWEQEDLDALRARRAEVRSFLKGSTTSEVERGMGVSAQLARWKRIYASMGIVLDSESIKVPEQKRGFDRLIVVAQGLSYATLALVLRSKFDVYLDTEDLDGNTSDCRSAKEGSYALWVRDCREADEENREKSAEQFQQEDCETLMERLLHELAYHNETGQHLDLKCWTICAGSRFRDGGVPYVDWFSDDRGLFVYWCGVAYRRSYRAVRSAVR